MPTGEYQYPALTNEGKRQVLLLAGWKVRADLWKPDSTLCNVERYPYGGTSLFDAWYWHTEREIGLPQFVEPEWLERRLAMIDAYEFNDELYMPCPCCASLCRSIGSQSEDLVTGYMLHGTFTAILFECPVCGSFWSEVVRGLETANTLIRAGRG